MTLSHYSVQFFNFKNYFISSNFFLKIKTITEPLIILYYTTTLLQNKYDD